MRKLFVALLLVVGAAFLALPAFAEYGLSSDTPGKVMNAQIAEEMRSRASRLGTSDNGYNPTDTTWVGYNPAYAGSNYWSIGVGDRRPNGVTGPNKADVLPVKDEDMGYWDWDNPVHGDTLQGWWPMRHCYTSFFVANLTDVARPWHAIDIGNSISYVINQGPGNRRTYGVTSAWHEDPGVTSKTPDPDPEKSDVNPSAPRWSPIAGSMSAWCGLRAHGDVEQVDALTGNPYNADALEEIFQASPTVATGPGWTNYRFPGYADQWDQMLFKDIDISGASSGANVSVSFSYRTRMSTGKGTSPTTRTGWFDKDPLVVTPGNFISSTDAGLAAPIDSFMVYVGAPVVDTVGAVWTGSDGQTHPVFDPVRRWFGELIKANESGGHYQLFTTYGDDPAIATSADSNLFNSVTAVRNVTYGDLQGAWGNKVRLVFRVKTNRGFSDDAGSLAGSYNSGYLGAAQVDNVSIDLGAGPVSLGGFDTKGDIDNSTDNDQVGQNGYVNNNWHTSSKPPAIVHHIHDLADLLYQDLCGPPGAINRVCDLGGNVISQGDHDLGEAFNGPFGTAEQERFEGITSPTINLSFEDNDSDPNTVEGVNNMGLNSDTAVPTGNYLVGYHMYTGGYDLFSLGSGWQVYAKAYPATQVDGQRTWTTMRHGRFQFFNPDKQCFRDVWNLSEFGQLSNANPGGAPDSVRIGLRKITQCWRFGITTNCGTTLGGYQDIVSFGIQDGARLPMSVLIWELWQDTFPANESAGLPGSADFDTTVAIIGSGLNTAPLTGDLTRYDVPGDSLQVDAHGDSVEVQLKFRILPGPGNYVIPGDRCSGLRAVASVAAPITLGDGSFWSEYIENPGKDKDDMPTTGDCASGGPLAHEDRWSELVWCNARMDTAEANLFPIAARNINSDPQTGTWATIYHEDDKHLAALGVPRPKCFLIDTLGAVNMTNITCNSVPAWVTDGGAPYRTGYDGNANTVEGTKIIPDGLLTPGSHVQYFFFKKDLDLGLTAMVPDTNFVNPQDGEGSFDGHRWQQFSVLPDAWKFTSYGGLGKACMLMVDWDDSNGTERVWVAVADSIGATSAAKRGAHNGWSAPSKVDINDPAYFVRDKNASAGSTWDLYSVKAAESLNSQTGTIGSRLAFRGGGTLLTDKWAKNAPTPEMLEAYYRVLMILTGGLNTFALTGPFNDRSQDDTEVIRQFVVGATLEAHRGLFVQGDAYVEDLDANGNTTVAGILSVSLREASYLRFSGNAKACIDLIPQSMITTNGDVYGIRNTCLQTLDVLNPEGDGVPASYYDPVGANPLNAPYVASVFTDAEPAGNEDNHWQALIDGWDTFNLRSRLCDKTHGRLAYFFNVFNNIFGKICSIAGSPQVTLDVPGNAEGRTFVEFAGQNPLRQGNAVIRFALTRDDKVTAKVYDVSGRLVRTLADGQVFKAGDYTGNRALQWDGLDNNSRQVARGVYFVHVRLHSSLIDESRKMIVLK
jgi:hypothetical protein